MLHNVNKETKMILNNTLLKSKDDSVVNFHMKVEPWFCGPQDIYKHTCSHVQVFLVMPLKSNPLISPITVI